MPTALTTINVAKEQAATYQPLLLAEFTFADGAVLRLSTHPLNTSEGGVQYGGNDYLGRISDQTIQQVQALSETGVDLVPSVSMSIADPAAYIYSNWETAAGRGFKGASLTLRLVFYDVAGGTFSSDSRIPFVGICDKPASDAARLTVTAVAKTSLMRAMLPVVPIQRRCPWINPTTTAQRAEASDEDSCFYECGETRDTTTAPPCSYTLATCTQLTRFGGITYSAPAGMRVREYVSGNWSDVRGVTNEASYGDRIPMLYGKAWIEPPVLTAIPDGNYLRGECIVALGPVTIHKVLVNGIELSPANLPDGTPISGANPDFRYNWINDGTRDGSPNADTPWSGTGDPYGSMSAIMFVLPRSQGGGDGVPRVRVLASRKDLRKYQALASVTVTSNVAVATLVGANVDIASNDAGWAFEIIGTTGASLNGDWTGLTNWTAGPPGTFTFATTGVADGTYTGGYIRFKSATENAAWVIADLLTWTNYRYEDLDLASFCAAAQVLEARPTAIVLRQRRSAAEIIRSIRQAHGLLLVPEHSTGKLHLYVKQTLADQQPATISGSNYDTTVASKTAAGITTSGYVAYKFDAASILRSDLPISLKELPRSASDSPNRISLSFQDRTNDYAISTLSVVDSDDAGRLDGQEIAGSLAVNADGLTSYADAMRSARVNLAEIHRGNTAGDTRGTRVFEWDTTVRGSHLRVGHIVLMTDTLKGLTNQLLRITKIQPAQNYETVRLTAHWHDDNWYTDAYAATGALDATQYTANPVSDASPLDIGGTVGSNLARNAGFENGKVQWHGDIDHASVTLVTDEYDSGLQCLKIAATGATEIHQPYWFQDGKYDVMTCVEGEQFIFTGRYKFAAASSASVAQARIAFYQADGTFISAVTAALDPANTDWSDFSLSATAPALSKYMGIFPWFGTLTAGALYIDTLFAGRVETVAPGHVTALTISVASTQRLRGRLLNVYQLGGNAPAGGEFRGFNAVRVYFVVDEGQWLDLGSYPISGAVAGGAWQVYFQHDAPDAAILSQTFIVQAENSHSGADFGTAPSINLNASGEATTATAPSNVLQTINGNAQDEYSIKLDWAKPSPQNGVVGYHFRSVIYSDDLGEIEVETIDHPGIQGYDVVAAWSAYRELPTPGTRWIKSGIRSFNAFGQTSVWVWSDLAPLEVDPATIIPQPGVSDWAIIDPTELNGGYGANQKQQKARLRINVIAIPEGADYVTAWLYIDGQYRDVMSTATLGNNDIWIDQPTTATTYDCKLVGNRYSAVRMWGSDNDVKTFSVAAWQLPAALSTFTVTAEGDDGTTGKTLYRLKYVVTGVTDVNRMGVAIFARWTDASWNPVAGTDGDWKEVSWIKSTANSLTWYSSNDYLFAAPGPGVTEYRQFAAIAKNYADDYDTDFATGDAIVVNSTRTSDGGFNAGTIDPTTIGPGLTVDSDGLASLSRGLMNGDFENGLEGWTATNGWSADSAEEYSGAYCAKCTASGADEAIEQSFACIAGQSYRLEAWTRKNTNSGGYVIMQFVDSAGNALSTGLSDLTGGDVWARHELTGVAPATSAKVRILVTLWSLNNTGRLLVDQVHFAPLEPLGPGLSRDDSGVSNTERGLKNSDFEFGLTDWNYSAQWTADTAEAYKGTAAKCTCNGADQYLCQDLPVAPGQVVRFEAWAKESGNSTSSIQVIWYNAAGSVISTISTTITGDTYALYAVVGTAPASAATARVNIAVPAANTTGRVMVDQAVFTYLEPTAGPVTRTASGVNLALDSSSLVVADGAVTTVALGILTKLGISDQFTKAGNILTCYALGVNYLVAGTALFTNVARFERSSGGYVEISSSYVTIYAPGQGYCIFSTNSLIPSLAVGAESNYSLTANVNGVNIWKPISFFSGSDPYFQDPAEWRTALALGNSATKNTGTTSGTVATGDHNHSGVYAAASHTHSYNDVGGGRVKYPESFTEAIALSGITTTGWVPCYDASGTYLGKIPYFT